MRIGIDGMPLLAPKTGVGHYTFELTLAMARMAPSIEFELISHLPLTADVVKALQDGPENLRVATPRRFRRWWAIGMPRYARQAALDVFHGTNYEVPLWNRARNVLTVHDLSVIVHPDKHERHIARRARRRLPIMLRASARIITDTETVKGELVKRFKVNEGIVSVVPLAPRTIFCPVPPDETAEVRRRLGIDDNFLLHVGTIEPRKNLSTLVRACADILRTTEHRPQLVIAGPRGWLTDEFDRALAEANLGDRLRMIGYVGDADLRALYSSCRVFVYPSLYEGFGLPPLEAMACGAPVIASRINALVETLGDHARFIEPTDDRALADAIVTLLENPDERERLSQSGPKLASRFSWKRTAELTLAVYEDIWRRATKSTSTE